MPKASTATTTTTNGMLYASWMRAVTDLALNATAHRKPPITNKARVAPWLLQVAAKQRADEATSLEGSWFPSVMRRMLIMVQGKEEGEVPQCMTKLAAALHKVLCHGLVARLR